MEMGSGVNPSNYAINVSLKQFLRSNRAMLLAPAIAVLNPHITAPI